jgi:ketosteroid isomerase-like protein
MDLEARKAAAVRLLQTMGAGALDESLLAADLTWWVQGRGDHTLAQFNAAFDRMRALQTGPGRVEVLGITAEGERVAVETRSFVPLANDQLYSNTYHYLIRFRGDLICEVKEYYDSAYTREVFAAAAAPPA